MNIEMRDGRRFMETPMEIVQAMKDIAFGVDDLSPSDDTDWVAAQALNFEGAELEGTGEDVDAKQKRLVE